MNLYQYLNFSKFFGDTLIGYEFTPEFPNWIRAYHVDQLKLMRNDFSIKDWAMLVKAAKLWDYDPNKGEEYLALLISGIKRSYLWKTVFHGCNAFVIIKQENGERLTTETQPDCVILKNFNMYGYKEKGFHVNKPLYHTSPISGIKRLHPSIGARNKNHSIYDTMRIYCTTTPTSAGGWPLLIGNESELAVKSIEKAITEGKKDWAIKYIAKWVVKSETLHIYEMPKMFTSLYPDHEIEQSMDKEGMVFYIKTNKPIPVKEIVNTSRKVNLDYLKSKPILGDFIKENIGNIKQEMKSRLSEEKSRLGNFKLLN